VEIVGNVVQIVAEIGFARAFRAKAGPWANCERLAIETAASGVREIAHDGIVGPGKRPSRRSAWGG